VRALENWDRRILAGLVEGLDRLGDWRLLLLPDHATPLRLKTHTSDPVPYLLVDSRTAGRGSSAAGAPRAGRRYTEADTAGMTPVPGHELMSRLVAAPAD
jgi:2,3-bisphosphoglycerate-independent phosphoglycerate mutase